MKKTFTYFDDDENELQIELPTCFEVCSQCEGHGTHLNEAIGSHCYSLEEFDEAFDDDESREQYFKRGGIYDVTCKACKGQRVVEVIDTDAALTAEQREAIRLMDEHDAVMADLEAMERAERRAECGEW